MMKTAVQTPVRPALRTIGLSIVVAASLAACLGGSPAAAPGDWLIELDASAVQRITRAGDSLWCATAGGVLLFDLTDSTFTQFTCQIGLRSNDITAVAVDERGDLWAAMRGAGIARIDDPDGDQRATTYTAALSGILSDSVTCLLRVGGDIYYGCTGGVAKFFANVPAREPNLSDSLAGRTVHDLAHDPAADMLWIACEGGVARFDRETFAFAFFPIGDAASVCLHDGEVYCAAGAAVRAYDGGAWTQVGADLPMPLTAVASGGGGLWCETPERVYLWSGSYWVHQQTTALKTMLRQEYRIPFDENTLTSIAIDGAGHPWIGGVYPEGSRGFDLCSLSGTEWTIFSPARLQQNRIVALDADESGDLWVSTGWFGIAYRSADGRWLSYTKIRSDTGDDEALSYHINNLALLYDTHGYLWCNSLDYDLDRIDVGDPLVRDDDVWSHYALGEGTITSNRFVRAVEDPAGNRWMLSDDDYYEDGRWGIDIASVAGDDWLAVNPTTHPSMEAGNVFDCAFDQSGAFLALRGYGVRYWGTGGFDWTALTSTAGDYWYTVVSADQLPSDLLWAIERAEDGSLWIGTSGGLVHYRSGQIDSFTVKTSFAGEGLIGTTVYDIAIDRHGVVWAATSRGLNRLSPEGEITGAWTTAEMWQSELQFVYPDDVIAPLPNHICRALAYDPAGDFLWIGTENGLARLDVAPSQGEQVPLSSAILYPNPVHAGRGDTVLRISRIGAPVDIKVYTPEGELVHEVSGVADGEIAWDLLTLGGYRVTSGIYLVVIESAQGKEMRKVAVVK